MRSRAAAPSLRRGFAAANSEGLKLVCLLVEPFGRPRRRKTGSASLSRALARSKRLISSSSRHKLACRHPVALSSPSYPSNSSEISGTGTGAGDG